MSNMKTVALIAATDAELMAAVEKGFVSTRDLELAIKLLDDELISLREHVKRLEQGRGQPPG